MGTNRGFAAFLGAVIVAGTLTASDASASTRVYVRVGPPAPIVETRVVAPGPGYVWVGGYHRWEGHRYVWVPGRWNRPPHRHAVWVSPHWSHDHHGYYMTNGHWR
jgi:WXXGXW repeat (2 copies)